MTIDDTDVVSSEHLTSFEEVARAGRTFTYEGEDLCDEQLLKVRCGSCGIEFCQPRKTLVVEYENCLDHDVRWPANLMTEHK